MEDVRGRGYLQVNLVQMLMTGKTQKHLTMHWKSLKLGYSLGSLNLFGGRSVILQPSIVVFICEVSIYNNGLTEMFSVFC